MKDEDRYATDEEVDQIVAFSPPIRAYLEEHRRREALPRQVCPECQFEYHAEETHVCRQFERAPECSANRCQFAIDLGAQTRCAGGCYYTAASVRRDRGL